MYIVNQLYFWTDHILGWGEFILWIWAFADCIARRHDAFPAADKLTKPAWLAILAIGALLGTFTVAPFSHYTSPVHFIGLIATVAASVYLADVRPAVREISGGR